MRRRAPAYAFAVADSEPPFLLVLAVTAALALVGGFVLGMVAFTIWRPG